VSIGGNDYLTLSYKAGTGTLLWSAMYNDPRNGDDSGSSLVLSPKGGRVYVTGSSATIAYIA
jgi:hypothetical protein